MSFLFWQWLVSCNLMMQAIAKCEVKSVIIHHLYIILFIDPGLMDVEILPTSQYRNLSLFICVIGWVFN